MDYRNLLGTAAIILSSAVFVHSLGSANALPQGPNVSIASNPIVSFTCTQNSGYTIPSNFDFIITDISTYVTSGQSSEIQANGTIIWELRGTNMLGYQNINFTTGIKVVGGQAITCSANYDVYLSGYLAHQ